MNVKGKYKLVDGKYVVNPNWNERKQCIVKQKKKNYYVKVKDRKNMKGVKVNGIGRPKGFKMKPWSKKAISESKMGGHHTEESKKKISDGVKRFHEVGAPIEVLMKVNLDECGQFMNGEYINVGIPNPVVGQPAFQQRYHVAIIEQFLGRKLKRAEQIHHWGDKDDNRIEMLSLCKNKREHCMLDKIKNRTIKGE